MSIENIRMVSEERKIYDKKDIALAIGNSTFDDELNCSLLAEEHLQRTTKVVSSFSFQDF